MSRAFPSRRPLSKTWLRLLSVGILALPLISSAQAIDILPDVGQVHAKKQPLSFEGYDPCLGPRSLIETRDWWVVYADRDGIPVYQDSKGVSPLPSKSLKLLEHFFVLEEDLESEMLLLGRSESRAMDEEEPKISAVVGWVKWENLILSYEPIKNPETLISRKAFIINDWRRFTEADLEQFEKNMVVVRAGPSEDARELRTITGMGQRFSYIYKNDSCANREPEWYLIGRTKTIHYGRVHDNIVGWIPSERAQPWNTRQALEPVPDRPAPAHVYVSREDVVNPVAEPLFEDQLLRDPWPADRWRYPVLEHEGGQEGILIGWHGRLEIVGDENDQDTESSGDEGDEIATIAAETYEVMKHVNIIFVMDATASMGPYLDAVSRAVTNIMTTMDRAPYHTDMRVRFGAAIYRDLKDRPEERFNLFELSPSPGAVARFLETQREPTLGMDPDYEEALFQGIEKALLELADPKQTNILVVIGDAGNNDRDRGLTKKLLSAIGSRQPRIIALHLRRPPSEEVERSAIEKFEPDMSRVFSVVRQGQDELYETMAPVWRQIGQRGEIPRASATNLFRTSPGEEDIRGAQRAIEDALTNVLDLNGDMMNRLSEVLSGDVEPGASSPTVEGPGDPSSDYMTTAATLELLMRQAGDPDAFKALISAKVQIFEPGWVRSTDDDGQPLMRPVQLVSLSELDETERALNRLFHPGRIPDRNDLLATWKSIVGVAIGDEPQNAHEFLSMSGGISFRDESRFLSMDFDEIMTMPEQDFQEMLEYVKKARISVSALRTDRPEIWFKNYSEEFAWIPMNELP